MSPAALGAFREVADYLARDYDATDPELARSVRSYANNMATLPATGLPIGGAVAKWCKVLSEAASLAAARVATTPEDRAELLRFSESIAP